MNTYAGRRRSFLLVALLLLISILLEQYWIARLLPWMSDFGGIRPKVVFLDIPIDFPMTIDLIPVGLLFSFFYSMVLAPGLPRVGGSIWPSLQKRVGAVLLGLTGLLACLLVGGGIFYLLEDHLPREVRNGIDSFGVQADIYLPYPGEGVIHLRGSMLLLVAVYIGMRIWMRRAAIKPAAIEVVRTVGVIEVARTAGVIEVGRTVGRKTGERSMGEGKKISMQIPEPVLVEESQELAVGAGRVYPCVVDMEMAPRADRK
jgi:hypothetical protein